MSLKVAILYDYRLFCKRQVSLFGFKTKFVFIAEPAGVVKEKRKGYAVIF